MGTLKEGKKRKWGGGKGGIRCEEGRKKRWQRIEGATRREREDRKRDIIEEMGGGEEGEESRKGGVGLQGEGKRDTVKEALEYRIRKEG